tara:strand:+ start:1310 stop:1546 length:237 start_codon:yes stop_codon:yes gene_type:complete
MAIVKELSGNGGGRVGAGPENKLSSVNRSGSAVVGTMTPAYIGEIATDTTADENYVAKRADGDMDTDTLGTSDWARSS